MLNYEFMASSEILIAVILKIGCIGYFVPTHHVLTGRF